jgi:hypothetical protein
MASMVTILPDKSSILTSMGIAVCYQDCSISGTAIGIYVTRQYALLIMDERPVFDLCSKSGTILI